MSYLKPSDTHHAVTYVSNSKFICTIGYAETPVEAHNFIDKIRKTMTDASHHAYAFRIGYGNSVIEGMSDDNEPSGTAGPPLLAVLRGSEIGDIVVVVTRYFGGTKLGTGGLVRAYTEAVKICLAELKTEIKIAKKKLGLEIPYTFYERMLRSIKDYDGIIETETFADKVALIFNMPNDNITDFRRRLSDLTAGQIDIIFMD